MSESCPDCGGGLLGGLHEPWCMEAPNDQLQDADDHADDQRAARERADNLLDLE